MSSTTIVNKLPSTLNPPPPPPPKKEKKTPKMQVGNPMKTNDKWIKFWGFFFLVQPQALALTNFPTT